MVAWQNPSGLVVLNKHIYILTALCLFFYTLRCMYPHLTQNYLFSRVSNLILMLLVVHLTPRSAQALLTHPLLHNHSTKLIAPVATSLCVGWRISSPTQINVGSRQVLYVHFFFSIYLLTSLHVPPPPTFKWSYNFQLGENNEHFLPVLIFFKCCSSVQLLIFN